MTPTKTQIARAVEAQRPVIMEEPVHKNVYCALAAAQAEFSAPKKDAMNPAFKSRYADLASVVEAVAPALSRHGVSFSHETRAIDFGAGPEACMVTVLTHGESDTRAECAIPLIVGKRDMQGFKSATTYAKRIGLESVTGVAPDDDDGNAAVLAAPPRVQKISADEYSALREKLDSLNGSADAAEAYLCKRWSIRNLTDLTKPQWAEAVALVEQRIAARQQQTEAA